MGLFSTAPLTPRVDNLLDTLCARLEMLTAYTPGEHELLMLQHKFVIEWADGTSETRTSTLEAYGAPTSTGSSAMARYVGIPCGVAVQLVLDGVLSTSGVHAPYSEEVCDLLRKQVEKEGLGLAEKIL